MYILCCPGTPRLHAVATGRSGKNGMRQYVLRLHAGRIAVAVRYRQHDVVQGWVQQVIGVACAWQQMV